MSATRTVSKAQLALCAAVLISVLAASPAVCQNTLQVMPPRPLPMITSSASRPVVLVTDRNGEPIPYASVSVGGGSVRITDMNGQLQLTAAGGDSLRLVVRRIGYREHDMKVGRASPTGPFLVELSRVAQNLDAVQVAGRVSSPLQHSGFYDRMLQVQRGAIVGEFYTPEMLSAKSSGRFSALLQGSKFVKFATIRGKMVLLGRSVGVNASSSDRCNMTVIVDGMRINGDIPASANSTSGPVTSLKMRENIRTQDELYVAIDEVVSGGEVSAIEVYPSNANAPASLQPLTGGGSCGIVAIWTGGRQR